MPDHDEGSHRRNSRIRYGGYGGKGWGPGSSAPSWSAILPAATLVGADLSGADLSGADLLIANLSGADLSGASLGLFAGLGADLTGAILANAIGLPLTTGPALYDINTDFTGTGFDPVAAQEGADEPGPGLLVRMSTMGGTENAA